MFEHVCNTLVLALGNPLCGDDGVGTAVLQALAAREDLPDGVMLSCRGVNGLLAALIGQQWRRIILVDAANMGRAPGEWVRFTLNTARLVKRQGESGGFWHQANLAEVLALAELFAAPLPDIVIYGIQPLTDTPSTRLSTPVQPAVRSVCMAVLQEVCNEGSREWATMNGQPISGQRTEIPCPRF